MLSVIAAALLLAFPSCETSHTYDSGANVAGAHISERIRRPQRGNAPGPSAMVPQRAVKECLNGL